jgi:hypothetical protein
LPNRRADRLAGEPGLKPGDIQPFRDRTRFQNTRLKKDFDALVPRARTDLFDPLDGLEHILNAFFAALTGEPLIADDFESDGLKHRFCVTPGWRAVRARGPTPLIASKKYAPRPHSELIKIEVTLAAIATMPQIG